MATLIDKNQERRVQYKIDANKTKIMFPNLECLSAALLREILPSGSTPAGDSAYITDASNLVPVESLKVNIQPNQAGTGDPSPENVRPISGWDTVKVTRTGRNMLQFPYDTYKPGNYTVNGVTFAISSDGTIATSGTAGTAGRYNAQVFIGRFNGKDIAGKILTGCPSDGSNNKYRIIVQHYGSPWNTYVSDYGTGAIIPDAVKDDDIVNVAVQIHQEINSDGLIFKPMIRSASDADATFEPYQGESYSTPLGRTVYGGTLDVTTGELIVDKGYIASYNGETLPSTWMSDRDVYSEGATPTTGAQVLYELAEPQKYALIPQQVALLKGINNVFANAGTVEVMYSEDIQLYIDKKIAETQALVLEN